MSDVSHLSLADPGAAAGGRRRHRLPRADAAAQPEPLALHPRRRPAPASVARRLLCRRTATPGRGQRRRCRSHAYYTCSRPATSTSSFSLRADALTAMMLVMVTFIGTLHRHLSPSATCTTIRRLSALLRRGGAVHLLDDAAGAGRQLPPALRRLGRRRPVQLPADRLLVHQAVGRGRRPQGVPRHAHRRRRPVPRHPAAVASAPAITWISTASSRKFPQNAGGHASTV